MIRRRTQLFKDRCTGKIYHWYSDTIFENKQQFRWKYFLTIKYKWQENKCQNLVLGLKSLRLFISMLISCDINTNIVINGGRTCTHSWSLHEDWLRKACRISCSRCSFWEQIEGCSGKFMSAPVDAAIPRDTLVYTAIVLFEQSKCVDSIFTSDKRLLTVYNI
jgi:hypothetical protein